MRGLVVDDSAAARAQALTCLEDALHQLGVEDIDVREAGGGVAALGVLAREEVDVLLVDLHMPDMTGLEVLKFWSERKPEGAVAFVVSTEISDHDLERVKVAGAERFISKPVSIDTLVEVLRQAWDAAEGEA